MDCEFILARSRIHRGEGELEYFDPRIGSRRGKMASPKWEEVVSSIPCEGEFLKSSMRMKTMIGELYQDWKKGEWGGSSHD